MKAFTIVLLLVASVASAGPGPGESTERLRYDRGQRDTRHPDGPTQLAAATTALWGTEFIMVDEGTGAFSKLRIVAETGRVDVQRVKINFVDGSVQAYEVNRVVDEHQRALDIDLQGTREISRMAITTARSRGTYAVYGL